MEQQPPTGPAASGPLDITQEFLAQTLSVRRASVDKVASGLAAASAITYTRGTLTVQDRQQLEVSHA